MLKISNTLVKGHPKNISFYKERGYKIKVDELILIDIKDLSHGSKNVVLVSCDFCYNEYNTVYKTYYKSTNGLKDKYHCKKCKYLKTKETLKKKYGVTNSYQIEDIKNKAKNKFLEKYNGYPLENKEIRDKIVETWKSKYGTTHPLLNEEYKKDLIDSNNKKYGLDYYINSDNVKQLQKNSYITDVVNNYTSKLSNRYKIIDYKDNNIELYHIDCNSTSGINRQILYDRIRDNTGECCIKCNPLNSNISSYELELRIFLKDLNIEFLENDKSLLNGKELDIYITSKNIAIEFNGLYWHSEKFKDKKYHLNKTLECIDKGVSLIHVFEDDWIYRKNIIKSIIKNRLNIHDKILYGRKCEIKEVKDIKSIKNFLNENHIQGYCKSTYKIGLYHDNILVSLMCFGYRKTNSKKEFELVRFCNLLNYKILGASTKLFDYFLYNTKENCIISYADISLFEGKMYETLKFKEIHLTKPNYYWVINGIKEHRWKYNKQKLIKEGFDSTKTELEIMHERGYYRIWGCGQIRYEYKI